MISRIIRILISILGVILGTTSYFSLERYFPQLSFGMENIYLVGIVSGLILGEFTEINSKVQNRCNFLSNKSLDF